MTVFEMIEAQQKGLEDTTIFMVGEQLKDICRADPACVAIVLEDLQNEAMHIKNCEKQIKAQSDKISKEKKLRSVGISPKTAEVIIRKFYGLPVVDENKDPVPAAEESAFIGLGDLLM